MKQFAVIQKDKTILVRTPNPYVVDTYKDVNPVILEDTRYRLHEACKFLWDCLRVLKISKKVAQDRNYTLNTDTGMKLRSIALNSPFISSQMFKTITYYDW